MATANLSGFFRRLTRGMGAETLADQPDRQLVERSLARRDEAAFEALLRRHGPMVYRVCWRVVQQEQDTEDAFQSTFLILAQKLRTVRKHACLASWLHGVAYRVALKAKAQAATRRRHEQQAPVPQAVPPDEVTWGELRSVLDAELAQLPEKWRLPLILCYLERRTQDEAAAQLRWGKTTLRRRMDEGRAALGRRLSRRGVVWPAALSAVLLSDCVASAVLPAGLAGTTVEAATRFAAGQATAGVVSAKVAALTEAVLKSLWMTKLKVATVVLLALGIGLLGAGAGIVVTQSAAAERENKNRPILAQTVDTVPVPGLHQAAPQVDDPKDQKEDGPKDQKDDSRKNPKRDDDDDDDDQKPQGVVKALDVSKNTITLTIRRRGKDIDQTFALTRNVRVQVAGRAADLSGVNAGMQAALKLSKDKKAVVEIKEAKGPENGRSKR